MKQAQPQDIIHLQNCHATQHKGKDGKTDWSIEQNINNNQLGILPRKLSEKEVFSVLAFARKYELIAFNAGIQLQKNKHNDYLYAQIKEQKAIVKELTQENEKLALVLDNLTQGA